MILILILNRFKNDFTHHWVRGTFDHRLDSTSNIAVVRWHDNSVVTLASNCQGVEPVGSAKRWSSAEKCRVDITQPYVVFQYNKYMGGVDRMDQNIATYRISIQSCKWWWPLFAYLLDVAMQNAWIIYRQTEGARRRLLDQLEFTTHATVLSVHQSAIHLVVLNTWTKDCPKRSGVIAWIISFSRSLHSVVVQSAE